MQTISGFYKALVADQLVAIGESQSSLKADATTVLTKHIQARSLIAAPISFNNELLGFLAVEGDEPRLWTEEDKHYVHSAAQMVAIAAPLATMEAAIEEVRLDQSLTAEIARAVCDDTDWRLAVKNCADQLCRRLGTERFLVLMYDPDAGNYDITYQAHPNSRQQLRHNLPMLNDVDQQMLAKSVVPIAIENLDEDLKLLAWRDIFLSLGVKSLLVCNTALGKGAQNGLVVVAQSTARSWTRTERDLVQVVAQQIGIVLNQWKMHRQLEQMQQMQQTVQWGTRTLQTIQTVPELEQAALDTITQSLRAPLAMLITWEPVATMAQISACVTKAKPFQLDTTVTIPRDTDALINWALQTDGVLPLTVGDVPSTTRDWLSAPGIGTLLVMALTTASTHTCQAILVVADQEKRIWSEQHIDMFGVIGRQVAWARRSLLLTNTLTQQRRSLEQLNWYKHQALREIHQSVVSGLHRLGELLPQFSKPAQMNIAVTRYQQVLRQLNTVMSAIALPLQKEEWSLQVNQETIPLASLLKRMLERSEGIIHHRQLWAQVHNDLNLSLVGDVLKTEMILHELLEEACERSKPGGRIDIWCRAIDAHWLEIAITDHGTLNPTLLTDLQAGATIDLLQPSTLDTPPGLHFAICQQLVNQIGGELNLYQLEDERSLSRLVLPISTGHPKEPPRSRSAY